MKRIEWQSENGLTAEFHDSYGSAYIFESIESGMQGEGQTVKSPGRDGTGIYNVTRSGQTIRLKTHIISKGSSQKWAAQSVIENRDFMDICFDPKYFGELIYYAYPDDKGRKIRCQPNALPVKTSTVNGYFRANIEFTSEEPMWELAAPLSAALGITYSNFRFPYYIFPTPFAFIYTDAIITNPTIYDIPPKIYVQNSEISVEVRNDTTGVFLKINQGVEKDQRMVIDVRNARVTLEQKNEITGNFEYVANVLNRLSLDSDIEHFVVVPGENRYSIKQQTPTSKPVMVVEAFVPALGV